MRKQIHVNIESPLMKLSATFASDKAANNFLRAQKRIQNAAIRQLVNRARVYSRNKPFGPRWTRRSLNATERAFVNRYPMKVSIKNTYEQSA